MIATARPDSNWVMTVRRFVTTKIQVETCDFCAQRLPPAHKHLIEPATRQFYCACDACALTLESDGRFRAISPKTQRLQRFHLTDPTWETMQLPIDIVFFFLSGEHPRPTAIYPSPAGGMESALSVQAWKSLLEANPSLADMEPDVEALLVNRTKSARDYYRVSIDRCYALVGLMRTRWRGLSGGSDVWDDVRDFFAALDASAATRSDKAYLHA
jgi:hypothetical protein